jgi:hypothetical protein
MKNITRLYKQDSGGAPPPPPPPSGFDPPPPPPPPSDFSAPPQPPPPGSGIPSSGSAGTNAIIALIVGILSIFLACGCSIIGIAGGVVAWIMGKKELSAIAAGTSSEAGKTMANIGMWLGIVSVILGAIFFVIGVISYIINGSYFFYNF